MYLSLIYETHLLFIYCSDQSLPQRHAPPKNRSRKSLKRAAQLLRESQQNIPKAACRMGLNNPKYFSKYFKEEFGILPPVYQKKEGK